MGWRGINRGKTASIRERCQNIYTPGPKIEVDNISKIYYTYNMQIRPEGVRNYITPNGRDPYRQWYTSIKDRKTQAIITSRIDRLQHGNPGDCKWLSRGLYELRIDYGPGYRVYFGLFRNRVVILLGGGTKRTQQRDIVRSQVYWNEFLERVKDNDYQ